jgi:hypothetical protein
MNALPTNENHSIMRWAWAVFGLTCIIALLGLGFFIANMNTELPASWGSAAGVRSSLDWFILLGQLSIAVLAGFLGMLIRLRQPQHQISQLLRAMGMLLAISLLVLELTAYLFFTMPAPPAGSGVIALVQNVIWIGPYVLLSWMLAIFPTGYFLSRRWQFVLALALLMFAIPTLANGLLEVTLASAFSLPNPLITQPIDELYTLASTVSVFCLPFSTLIALTSLVVRFRTGSRIEQQQIKWLLITMAITVFAITSGLTLAYATPYVVFGQAIVMTALLPPIVGIGIAVLRYRLFEVDVFVRRTLLYSVTSALLGLTYFGLVVVLQRLIGTGQSQLITAISTLIIAVLFLPVRHRAQQFVDRRFFRKKYDTQQVLAAFAVYARDVTDLEKLSIRMLEVVDEAVQPETVGVWMYEITGNQ